MLQVSKYYFIACQFGSPRLLKNWTTPIVVAKSNVVSTMQYMRLLMATLYGTFAISWFFSIEPRLWPFESLALASRGVATNLHVAIPQTYLIVL